MKLYVETSVIYFYYATDAPEKMSVTREFFRRLGRFDCVVSNTVLEEVEKAPAGKRARLRKLLTSRPFRVLPATPEAHRLARRYLDEGVIPRKYYNDALHIAIASVAGVDGIVSWNMRHIVRLKTKIQVERVNRSLGYPAIHIATPEEVLE